MKTMKTIKTMKTMKKFTLLLLTIFAFISNDIFSQAVKNNGSGIFSDRGMAGRNGDGGGNGAFGGQGDWSTDFTVSEKSGQDDIYGGGVIMKHDGHGALGWGSFSAGAYTRAQGTGAVAVGFQTIAGKSTGNGTGNQIFTDPTSIGQVAMGFRTRASGNASVAMGQSTNAVGSGSVALGIFTTADTNGSVAIGVNNTLTTNGTEAANYYNYYNDVKGANGMTVAARAFVIGNGSLLTDGQSITGAGTKSDAFTVYFDGTTVIAGDLTVNSDMRLKSNIVSLGSTLSKLMQLDGKSYNMYGDDSKQKIGLLAQNVQEVFPELVKTGTDALGTLSVNYQGLIPVLINSIKELQAEILELKSKK
jgi:hypothetical protein